MGRRAAVAAYFDNLLRGDPVAVGVTIFFVVLAIVAVLFTLKVRRDLRRDDEAHARKYGRKLK